MKNSLLSNDKNRSGFSLIEVLAAVAIIGIITFLALPNIVTLKQDAEVDLAISRAEAMNMAVAAYVQANGQSTAIAAWGTASTNQAKWTLVSPFLAFAPPNLTDFMPSGYSLTFPATIKPLTKATITDPNSAAIPY
ncbi:MAG: prepilin-type N-terminal cleavage/methylation domain-containing protein [Verrucomicrobiales bacterium]|jgi:prepilin-type N-terminal cleavage/methylation domain-containing protein